MSKVIIYDATGKISWYDESANTPDYTSRTDAIINPDPALLAKGLNNLKVAAGVLTEKTQEEKDADAAAVESSKINKFDDLVSRVESLETDLVPQVEALTAEAVSRGAVLETPPVKVKTE